MIEKLDIKNGGVEDLLNCIKKLNELVDAVNELQEFADVADKNLAKLMEEATRPENVQPDAESRPENVQDKFAEQRKWIGKLCKFWDEKEEEKVFGILTTIDSDCGLSDICPYWNDTIKNWFEHCEPVKDDVIYKGGDNE